MVELEYKGRKFKSIGELVKFTGVRRSNFVYHYNVSNNVDYAMDMALNGKNKACRRPHKSKYNQLPNGEYVTADGLKFTDVKELLKHFDLTYYFYKTKIKQGFKLDEILKMKKNVHDYNSPYKEEVQKIDPECLSIGQLCRKLDLNYNTVIQRINRGYSLEQAIYKGNYRKCFLLNSI